MEKEFRLKFLTGPKKGKALKLVGTNISLGRSSDNDIVVPDKNLSRNHVVFIRDKDSFLIKDLGSKNGTFVNNKKKKEVKLSQGDIIIVGDTQIEFILFTGKAEPTYPTAAQSRSAQSDTGGLGLGGATASMGSRSPKSFKASGFSTQKGAASKKRLIIYSIAGLVVIFFVLNETGLIRQYLPTQKPVKSVDEPQEQLAAERETFTQTNKNNLNNLKFSQSEKEIRSKKLYSKAVLFHDVGKYTAAIKVLNEILSFYPNHKYASVKKAKWTKERDDIALELLNEGKKLFEDRYMDAAKDYFQKVTDFIPDKNHLFYKQAKEGLRAVELAKRKKR